MHCTGRMNDGIYNCYGKIDESQCFDCKHNSESEAEEKQNRFINYLDKINILYKYLMGEELLDGTHCRMPKLSASKAFSVIWFLQEVMHCLPDNIEQCKDCKELYDTDSSGCHLDDQYKYSFSGITVKQRYWGFYCKNCIPNFDFELK